MNTKLLHSISLMLRPVFTHRKLRAVVGLVFMLAIWPALLPPLAANTGGPVELTVRPEGQVSLTTEEAVRLPLKQFRLSQGYWWLHPGVDLVAQKGQPVYAVMAGRVARIEQARFGYGNHVVVSHGDYQSLYAHLAQINVSEGDDVTTQTVLGQVGSTGRSTGPHLHLEIRDSDRLVNPKTLLEIK